MTYNYFNNNFLIIIIFYFMSILMIWKFANESWLLTLQIPYYLSFENLLNHQYEQLLMALYFWCDTNNILRKLSMTFFQDKYSGLLNVFFYIYIFYWHLVMMRMSLCQSQLQWELAEMRSNFFLYCNQEKKLSNQIWLWLSTT